MDILESDKLKIKILNCLAVEEGELMLNSLKKKIGAANYKSVQRNCEFLGMLNLIKIKKQRISGVRHNIISITNVGKKVVENLVN